MSMNFDVLLLSRIMGFLLLSRLGLESVNRHIQFIRWRLGIFSVSCWNCSGSRIEEQGWSLGGPPLRDAQATWVVQPGFPGPEGTRPAIWALRFVLPTCWALLPDSCEGPSEPPPGSQRSLYFMRLGPFSRAGGSLLEFLHLPWESGFLAYLIAAGNWPPQLAMHKDLWYYCHLWETSHIEARSGDGDPLSLLHKAHWIPPFHRGSLLLQPWGFRGSARSLCLSLKRTPAAGLAPWGPSTPLVTMGVEIPLWLFYSPAHTPSVAPTIYRIDSKESAPFVCRAIEAPSLPHLSVHHLPSPQQERPGSLIPAPFSDLLAMALLALNVLSHLHLARSHSTFKTQVRCLLL